MGSGEEGGSRFFSRHITLDVLRNAYYTSIVIKSFKDKDTEKLFNDRPVVRFKAFERPARRKLLYLHRVRVLQDLAVTPGNRLEALKGNRQGWHSICVNDRWRICFRWTDGNAFDVEIVDYH